jgi:hypothetical protein
MPTFVTKCSPISPNNGIVKFQLTVESAPSSQDEHMWFNLLKSRVDFAEGDTIEVTLRKVPK